MADGPVPFSFTCVQCGARATRPYRGSGVRPSLCSNACKAARYKERNPDAMLEHRAKAAERLSLIKRATYTVKRRECAVCDSWFWARKAQTICSKECKLVRARRQLYEFNSARHEAKSFDCLECGTAYTAEYGTKRRNFCSNECRSRHYKRIARLKRKAAQRAATVEPVNPIKVFERDGWRCHICGCKTPRSKRGTYADRAPELDHIVPLSVGGGHSYANTACSCRQCNRTKGNTLLGQPSLLSVV